MYVLGQQASPGFKKCLPLTTTAPNKAESTHYARLKVARSKTQPANSKLIDYNNDNPVHQQPDAIEEEVKITSIKKFLHSGVSRQEYAAAVSDKDGSIPISVSQGGGMRESPAHLKEVAVPSQAAVMLHSKV